MSQRHRNASSIEFKPELGVCGRGVGPIQYPRTAPTCIVAASKTGDISILRCVEEAAASPQGNITSVSTVSKNEHTENIGKSSVRGKI